MEHPQQRLEFPSHPFAGMGSSQAIQGCSTCTATRLRVAVQCAAVIGDSRWRAGHSDEEVDRDMALAYMGLKPAGSAGKALPDSADPTWLDRESPPTVPITSSDHDSGNHDSAARSDVSCPPLEPLWIVVRTKCCSCTVAECRAVVLRRWGNCACETCTLLNQDGVCRGGRRMEGGE